MSVTTYSKEERKEQALKIGLRMAKKEGIGRVSVNAIARELKVSGPLLFHVFGNREGLHKELAKAAKAAKLELPVAQPSVRAARAEKKAAAAKTTAKLKKGAKPVIKMPKVPKRKAAAKKVVAAKKPVIKMPKPTKPKAKSKPTMPTVVKKDKATPPKIVMPGALPQAA
jgi:hypothetical protein